MRASKADPQLVTTTSERRIRVDAQGKSVAGPPNAVVKTVNFQ